jgi:hypothetical protein
MTLARDERAALIESYEAGPRRLEAAFRSVPPEARQWRPAAGAWSAHEVVVHCADSETASSSRIRFVLAEDDPLIVGYDQDAWAIRLDYHAQPIEPALLAIAATRASTAALLRLLPDHLWERAGRHTESGHYPAEEWLRYYAAHLEDHAQQIEANLAAWRERDVRRET